MMIACLILLSFICWRHFTWRALPWPQFFEIPRLQAHRGYHLHETENTLPAFRAAASRGAQMCELDVRVTRDGVPVVFHDRDLRRLAQDERLVENMLWSEMKNQVSAPTLQELLQDRECPPYWNIELKSRSVFRGRLEKAVAHVVRESGCEKRVIFSSFNPMSLWHLKRYLPAVPRALLVTQENEPGNKIYIKRMWLAPYVGVHMLNLDHRFVDAEEMQKWRARGVPVSLWTVNDKEKARAFLSAGAFSVISDVFVAESDLN